MFRRLRYYVYIMASDSGTLYIGFTNNLIRRACEHQNGFFSGFTKKYKCHKLIHFECFFDVNEAIAREKQLKHWNRSKKVVLIKKTNPTWSDLSSKLLRLVA